MKTWVRKSLKVGVLSAGILLVAGSAANADEWNTGGNVGVLNGNQVKVTAQAPIDVCGNAVGALLGAAQAGCVGGSSAVIGEDALRDSWNSFGNVGIGNGNQAKVTAQVPIDVCGNAVGALLGAAQAGCFGGSQAIDGMPSHESAYAPQTESMYAPRTESLWNSFGNVGLLNGNQLDIVAQVPINVCGNAIAIIGGAQASCVGGATAYHAESAHQTEADHWNTGGNVGVLNGNQIKAVVQVPINVCGNAIAIIGGAQASCLGGSSAVIEGGDHHKRHDDCDDQSGWSDAAATTESAKVTEGDHHHRRSHGDRWNTGGNVGLVNGNQVKALVQVPINVSGNAVGALLGAAQAGSLGGSLAAIQ